jgi:hypothetical protein
MNPNLHPQGRRTSPTSTATKVASAPLHELFWSVPETSVLLKEAEQRITAALGKALTPASVQLFDDLHEDLAC